MSCFDCIVDFFCCTPAEPEAPVARNTQISRITRAALDALDTLSTVAIDGSVTEEDGIRIKQTIVQVQDVSEISSDRSSVPVYSLSPRSDHTASRIKGIAALSEISTELPNMIVDPSGSGSNPTSSNGRTQSQNRNYSADPEAIEREDRLRHKKKKKFDHSEIFDPTLNSAAASSGSSTLNSVIEMPKIIVEAPSLNSNPSSLNVREKSQNHNYLIAPKPIWGQTNSAAASAGPAATASPIITNSIPTLNIHSQDSDEETFEEILSRVTGLKFLR